MPDYADLEIGLHQREGTTYSVEMRLARPDSETEEIFEPTLVEFDFAALQKSLYDPAAYGQLLTAALFTPTAQNAWTQALTATQPHGQGLRVRLHIGPSAPQLHALAWETLRNPTTGAPLGTDENVLFSRYLSSLDWRPVQLRPQKALTALVAVANPADLGTYRLAPVDVPGELERAQAGLAPLPITTLPTASARATLNNLVDGLREHQPDILYLAAHGVLAKGESYVFLENETGAVARVLGRELVLRLQELPERPRLIVLASCQSAGTASGEVLTALGPLLAEAGIPAVLAMQGNITMTTVAQFMPKFFAELSRDGRIDRALAVARGAVRERPDYWQPALFTRLKSGRIWYVPGFGSGGAADFEHWESLKTFIQEQRCTPILGWGVAEHWLGPLSELARRWAEKHHYPFARYEVEDMPHVAQYLSQRDGPKYLASALGKAVREALVERHAASLPPELLKADVWASDKLQQALTAVATARWAQPPPEAHQQLAALRLPIYITTSPSPLLALALKAAGADPQVRLCPWWSQRVPESKWRYEDEPTAEKPLVYHLFGHLNTPESLVLSEDNYFDFLIGITRNQDLLPDTVVNALTSTALLFLGFRPESWDFRVLFRMLMALEGSAQLRDFRHVTAQVEPDESRLLDFQLARRSLEKAFDKENTGLFWGHCEDFLNALAQEMGLVISH